MKAMLVTLLAVAAVAQSQAKEGEKFPSGIVSVGECPSITPKEDFDPAAYLGAWYEIERFNMIFEEGMDCTQSVYSDLGDGVMEVHNVGRISQGPFTAVGTVTVEEPGALLVAYEGYIPETFYVLDTDYTTFSAVYKCEQMGELRSQYAWIVSRALTLNQATLSHVHQVFASNGVDVRLFQPTHQGRECPYLNNKQEL